MPPDLQQRQPEGRQRQRQRVATSCEPHVQPLPRVGTRSGDGCDGGEGRKLKNVVKASHAKKFVCAERLVVDLRRRLLQAEEAICQEEAAEHTQL